MKKLFKMLAVVLALTLIIGTIPASAATEVTLKKTTKTLYLGGCTGAKTSGKKAPYYATATLKKLLNGFDSETMKVRATSDNEKVVATTTSKLSAVATGTANVTLKVYKGSVKDANLINTFSIKVTVKKNASASDLTVSGITDGSTFEPGKSVTVSLPKGTDTDKRRLTVKSGDVTVKSAGTNKWKVTFNKEGSFELLAETYQSATYKKATQSKSIKGTIKAVVKETPKPVAKQLSLNSFTITNVDQDFSKDDFKLYTLLGSTQINKSSLVNTVKVDKDGVATVTMFGNLEVNSIYYVEVDGNKTSFKVVSGKLADVKTIKINTEKAQAGVSTPITYSLLTAEGIDITSGLSSDINSTTLKFEIVDGAGKPVIFSEDASVSVHNITFNAPNKAVTVKATLTVGYNKDKNYEPITIESYATILSYEDSITGDVIYTFTKDDGIYMTAKDKVNTWFAANDDICVEALFKYTDNTYKTFSQLGVTKIKVADESIVMNMGSSTSGGYKLRGINPGTTAIIVMKGDNTVATIPVEVKAARAAARFEITPPTMPYLNTNSSVQDQIVIKAKAYDQYDVEITTAHFTAVQEPNTVTATGTVSGLVFVNGAMTINYSQVTLNSNPQDAVILKITCDEIKNCPAQSVRLFVKNVPNADNAIPTITLTGEKVLDTTLVAGTQEVDEAEISAVYRINNFFVDEKVGKSFTSTPSPALKNTDAALNCAVGDVVIGFTVNRDGTIINPATDPCIEYDPLQPYCVTFKAITSGHKLAKGSYIVTVYKITAGATSSKVETLGYQQFRVIDGDPEITFNKKADNLSVSMPAGVTNFFDFFCEETNINSNISSVDYILNSDGTTASVKSVTFSLMSSAYGAFNVTKEINQLVHLK